MTDLHVDKEFAALCPPLTIEDLNHLEISISSEGCRDPLLVWSENGRPLLLDGHNRLNICKQNNFAFKTKVVPLKSRDEACNWIIANQLGRRNLTEDQKSYLRGKRYNAEKSDQHSHPKSDTQNGERSPGPTHKRLAGEYGVSQNTITRDAKFASAVDAIAESSGEQTRAAILGGELKVTKNDVLKLAELPPDKQKSAVKGGADAIRKATSKKRTTAQKFDDSAFLPLCDQLSTWLSKRFDKAGGAEARDECAQLLGQFQRRIEQWQKHKPL